MVLGEEEFWKPWLEQKVNMLRARNHQGAMCLETQYSNK